jgi:hypothetical protein
MRTFEWLATLDSALASAQESRKAVLLAVHAPG